MTRAFLRASWGTVSHALRLVTGGLGLICLPSLALLPGPGVTAAVAAQATDPAAAVPAAPAPAGPTATPAPTPVQPTSTPPQQPVAPAAPAAPAAAPVAKPDASQAESAGTPATVIDGQQIETLLGKTVESPTGEDMGHIVDVLVDKSGQIRGALIDFGGFFGVGSRKIAIDWQLIRFPTDPKSGAVTVDLPRNQLRVAPVFKDGEPVVMLGRPAPSVAKPAVPEAAAATAKPAPQAAPATPAAAPAPAAPAAPDAAAPAAKPAAAPPAVPATP